MSSGCQTVWRVLMKKLCSCILLTVLFSSSCELPRADNDTWTVMSWNVQNLFDAVDDGNEYSEFDPSSGNWDERLYQRRLERLGEVTNAAVRGAPDLLILQELEKADMPDTLADGPLKGAGYHWRLAIPGYSIIRCGVLSRYPLSDITVMDCGSWGIRSLRPVLAFTVDTPGGPVRVLALHWKSPWDGRAATESARIKEATQVLAMACDGGEWSGIPTMIIGDLNTPGDGGVQPAALAPWEPGIEESTGVIFRSPEKEGAGLRDGLFVFFDPEPEPQNGSPGTYWYRDDWERPDRALLSPLFIDGTGIEFSSCRAGGTDVMEDSFGRPERWVSAWEEGYSDHLPLILEFSTGADTEPVKN